MNWHEALKLTVNEYDDEAPKWGEADCCQFVNSYWRYLTGVDFASKYHYTSRGEAQRILARSGGMRGLLLGLLGEPVEKLSRGAIVLVELGENVEAPGIYTGYCVYTIHPDHGVGRVSVDTIREAWPCPVA